MTFDYELALINQSYPKDDNGNPLKDDSGNQIIEESQVVILCGKKSITRSDFYEAATAGLKPVIILVVHPYEYDGQASVEFESVKYRVIRTYEVNPEEIELTCEKVTADG